METPSECLAEASDGERAILESVCSDFAQECLELGEYLLDGIQIGAVRREIKRNCAARLDGFFDSIDFVNADVVHEHDVAPLQRRSEKLFSIGLEHLSGHRSFEDERRSDAIMAQCCDESDGFPVAVLHFLDEPFALRCSPVEAGNRRRNAGFIDEDKPLRIEPWLLSLQTLTRGGDVRPVLLGGS